MYVRVATVGIVATLALLFGRKKVVMLLKMRKLDVKEWTSLGGYMLKDTTYQQLVKVFGEPNANVDENFKVDVEWTGTIDGEVFTIYNYKTGHSYLGDKGKDVEQLVGTNWHIGSQKKETAKKVIEYFEQKKGD